ncbi:MAG: phosphate ABC transporter substrate-binding protein PstS [Pseudolysinimonas sp.]|uniref:PstS family phosphate ABC transporter substrate-binding protein n=1 Tax=Pseudolysinimonas sp. TaxID=2680009 RepID=UPI003265FC07
MKITRTGSIAAIAIVGAMALAGCSTAGGGTTPAPTSAPMDYSSISGTLSAGGSSAQGNAESAWTAAFKGLGATLTFEYDKSQGSGGGRTKFLAGEYDFAGSDAPLSADETTSAATTCGADGAIDLPIYLDGVSIAYNVSGVTDLNLSSATIAKIFNLKITDWSDPAIAADNGGKALPSGPITTVVRSDSSGTATNFTKFLVGTAGTEWPYPAGGTWPITAGVSAQKGGSAVAGTIGTTAGAIGYVDHSAAKDSNGKALTVANVNGVAYTPEAVSSTLANIGTVKSNGVAGDLSISFDYSKLAATDYPVPLLSYAIICKTFANPAQAELTKAYLGFIASTTGQQVAAKNAGAAPLPESILAQITASLADVK